MLGSKVAVLTYAGGRVNVRGHGSCSRGRTDRPDVAENRDGAAAARQIKIESKTHSPVLQHAKHAKE